MSVGPLAVCRTRALLVSIASPRSSAMTEDIIDAVEQLSMSASISLPLTNASMVARCYLVGKTNDVSRM